MWKTPPKGCAGLLKSRERKAIVEYITAQIIVAVAIALMMCCSLKKVSRETLMIANAVINGMWAVHFLLLDAISGAVCGGVCVIMALMFLLKGKIPLMSGKFIPAVFIAAFVVCGVFTWDNIYSLLPVAGNILLVIAMWMNEEIEIKFVCIFVSLLFLIYNALILSVIGITGQAISLIGNTIYVVSNYKGYKQPVKR